MPGAPRSSVRRVALILGGVLGIVLCVLVAAPGVRAHATYVRSEPPSGGKLAAPGRIVAFFSEEVDPGFSEIQVLDAGLRRVDRRDTRPVPLDRKALSVSVPELPDGTYTVAWRTLSAIDGHTIQGSFPLQVGVGGPSVAAEAVEVRPHPLEVAFRGLTFLGSILLAGGLAFGVLVLRRNQSPAPGRTALPDLQPAWERRFRRLGLVTVGVLLVTSAIWLVVQVTTVADVSVGPALVEPMTRYLSTRNGLIWAAKSGALLLLVACLAGGRGWAFYVGGLSLSGAFMYGTSLTSHAAALARGSEIAATVDWLHQVGAAGWLGGLASALLVLPDVLRAPSTDRRAALAVFVPRLSALATASVALLIATGVFGALIQVGSLAALSTLYGGALLLKIGALAPMLVIGALNKWFFTPRFGAAAQQRVQTGADAVLALARRFRLGIVAEVALGAVILVATGVLTSAEPSREVWGRQPKTVEVAGAADDLRVQLKIEPGRVGENSYAVTLQGVDGRTASDVQRVQLRFDYVDQALGRGVRTAEPAAGGSYQVTGNDLSIAGRWQVEAAVRRINREDAVVGFSLDIGVQTAPNGGSAFALPRFSAPYAQVAMGLAAVGLVGLAASWVGRGQRWVRRRGVPIACAGLAILCGFLAVSAADFSRDLQTLRNPLAVTASTLEHGQHLYIAKGCVECHGDTGRGDGPLGVGLRPQPADFRIHMAAGHTDGQIFDWLSNGVPGTAMPGFGRELSEEERWLLINYIRNFASGG